MLVVILGHMELILFDVVAANGYQVAVGGPYDEFVIGVDGVWNFRV
jgi:hypothetical protein